jgi:DNA polymerase I-like protein with 3'-5' exonuclease and polymerase domains
MPFLTQGGGPYWRNGNIKKADSLLRWCLKNNTFILQNALYDVGFLRDKGYDFPWDNVEHDTMLLHHAISPEYPHNLGFIVSVYGKTPYWKEEFLSKSGKITDMPDEAARTYNARDCVVLHQVLPGLLKDLREDEVDETYYFESKPLLRVIGNMTERGVKFSEDNLNEWIKSATKEKESLEKELRKIAHLPDAFSLTSDEDLRWFFFGVPSGKFKKLYALEDYKEKEYVKYLCHEETCSKRTYWAEKGTKTPTCPKCYQVGEETGESKRAARRKSGTKAHQDLQKLEEVYRKTEPIYIPNGFTSRRTQKSQKVAVNQQNLLSLQRAVQNRIKQIDNLKTPKEKHEIEKEAAERLLTFLSKYFSFAGLQKNLSTYSRFPVRQDGRVHASFLIHGTATGRLASRDPNLQNIPKKMKGIRDAFVSAEDHYLLAVDYENLEVFVLAYVTGDEPLIEMVQKGMNIHDENTKTLFGLTPDNPKWKLARAAAKVFMFGGISYGGSDNEIYEKIILAAPELGLTLSEYKIAKQRFMEAHPRYAEWAKEVKKKALRTRKSITPLGRVRTLTGSDRDIEKQALNTPIQGGAGGIINRASVRVNDRLEGMKSGLILQVHDELIAEVHKDELLEVYDIMIEEMTKPVEINGIEREFRVDAEIGTSWGSLKEITRKELENYDL